MERDIEVFIGSLVLLFERERLPKHPRWSFRKLPAEDMEVFEDILVRGVLRFIAKYGGARRTLHLDGKKQNLWERHPNVSLSFTKSFEFFLDCGKAKSFFPQSNGDELFLALLMKSSVEPRHDSALCAFLFPEIRELELVDWSKPFRPDQVWMVESFQDLLVQNWSHAFDVLLDLGNPDEAMDFAKHLQMLLEQWFIHTRHRRDLCKWYLMTVFRVLEKRGSWKDSACLDNVKTLSRRQEIRKSIAGLLKFALLLQRDVQRSQAVPFFEEDYQTNQNLIRILGTSWNYGLIESEIVAAEAL